MEMSESELGNEKRSPGIQKSEIHRVLQGQRERCLTHS